MNKPTPKSRIGRYRGFEKKQTWQFVDVYGEI